MAVGRYFDVADERIRHAVGSYVPDNNRSQRTETGRNTLIVDCYNANPSSMRASVANFLAEPPGMRTRRLLILGDMLELGAWSAEEHAAVIRLAAQAPQTEVMLVGQEFAKARADMEPQPARITLFADREHLIAALRTHPVDNALVLIKGSRGIGLEKRSGSCSPAATTRRAPTRYRHDTQEQNAGKRTGRARRTGKKHRLRTT